MTAKVDEAPPVLRLPRVTKKDVSSSSGVRFACARIADATGRGILDPRRANSMLYAIATAGRALELEVAERMSRQLAELQRQPVALPGATYDNGAV